jgi:hypothetical protein
VVLGGLAVLASSWPSAAPGLAESGPGSDEVALPEPRDLPPADEVADEPVADDRDEPGDATMGIDVDCGGDDCERWRRSFGHSPVYSVWQDADELIFVDGDRLVAWDVATGGDRWNRPVAAEVALGPHEPDGGAWWRPPSVTGTDEWLVVLGPGGVQVFTRAGSERWTALLPDGGAPMVASVAGEVLLVVTEAPAPLSLPPDEDAPDELEPDPSVETDEDAPIIHTTELGIIAFELATGEVRWRRDGSPMIFPSWFLDAAEHDVVLIQEDRATVAMDVTDGTGRYRLEDAGDVARIGGFLVRATPMAGGDAFQVVIHAADDGRELLVLPERVIDMALVVDDLLIAIAHPSPGRDGQAGEAPYEAEAIAVDPAGALVWSVPIERGAAASCCASVLDAGRGMVRVAAGPGAAATYLDVRSGRVERRERAAGSASREEWAVGRDLVVSHASSDDQTTMRAAWGGQPVTVLGAFAQPVTANDGRGAEDGQLLIRVDNGLVAVELPAPGSS